MTDPQEPQPILVADLFSEILDALLEILGDLSDAEWDAPTVCPGWSVKDVALHLLGDEVGNLSRRRDGFMPPQIGAADWPGLVALINAANEQWVQATRRMSPRLVRDLLAFAGKQMAEYFRSLDPYAIGGPVSWAGPEPAPVWLDIAREYTERWHHQQQIRDVLGRPGLTQPRYLAPVLDTFVRALPHTYRRVEAAEGTPVALTISGDSGGAWLVRREQGRWTLYVGAAREPAAAVVLPQDVAWRLFSKGIPKPEALAETRITGDQVLGATMLDTVAVIA